MVRFCSAAATPLKAEMLRGLGSNVNPWDTHIIVYYGILWYIRGYIGIMENKMETTIQGLGL